MYFFSIKYIFGFLTGVEFKQIWGKIPFFIVVVKKFIKPLYFYKIVHFGHFLWLIRIGPLN